MKYCTIFSEDWLDLSKKLDLNNAPIKLNGLFSNVFSSPLFQTRTNTFSLILLRGLVVVVGGGWLAGVSGIKLTSWNVVTKMRALTPSSKRPEQKEVSEGKGRRQGFLGQEPVSRLPHWHWQHSFTRGFSSFSSALFFFSLANVGYRSLVRLLTSITPPWDTPSRQLPMSLTIDCSVTTSSDWLFHNYFCVRVAMSPSSHPTPWS